MDFGSSVQRDQLLLGPGQFRLPADPLPIRSYARYGLRDEPRPCLRAVPAQRSAQRPDPAHQPARRQSLRPREAELEAVLRYPEPPQPRLPENLHLRAGGPRPRRRPADNLRAQFRPSLPGRLPVRVLIATNSGRPVLVDRGPGGPSVAPPFVDSTNPPG